jgi:L-alanine-DL-glutamate epimerase-like enolase superfamily enzyme
MWKPVESPNTERFLSRRDFLAKGTAGLLTATALVKPCGVLAARATADSHLGRITITDIEEHEIHPDYTDWLHYELNHYYGPRHRFVYVVHTDKGLHGLGEGGKVPRDVIEKYIGSNPFDWVGDETSIPMAEAMYDLMGKAAGVPVYKLFGQRYRRWVPVSSWTVSTHPSHMADAVQRYSDMGYTWMKYHLSPFENVFDQLEAMERVAPEGFKLHFDLTRFHHYGHNPDLVERISHSKIAGCFEDPLDTTDIDAYIDLRKRIRLPILIHGSKIQYTFDVLRRAADGYIIGHNNLGLVMRRAGLFAAAGVPFTIQWVGGEITRAMVTHMQTAFKTAEFHFVCASETLAGDVVKERLEPINGFVRVPEGPGLGVTLDREALEQLKRNRPPEQPPYILKTRFKNGTVMYSMMRPPETRHFMVLPQRWRLIPMSFDAPLATEYWDDDGSAEYKAMFQRLEKEDLVLEKE